MTGRDANAGDCAQSCRWKYSLVEQTREGQYFPVEQDERGTYFYNSKDLCLLDRVDELAKMGVSSLKIEGRIKSVMYVSAVTGVYRQAIDASANGNFEIKDQWRDQLRSVSHRDYTEAFYSGDAGEESMRRGDSSYIRGYHFFAVVTGESEEGTLINAKAKFAPGDKVLLLKPDMTEEEITVGELISTKGVSEPNTKPAMDYTVKGLKAPVGSIIRIYNHEDV
jgi:putative protease